MDRCGSLWIVVDRCGSLWVVPGFSDYDRFARKSIRPVEFIAGHFHNPLSSKSQVFRQIVKTFKQTVTAFGR